MKQRPPRSTRTDTSLPNTTLVRSTGRGEVQHRAVAGAKAGPGIRGIEESLDLRPVEIVDQRLVGLLGRDRSDAERLIQAGRNPILDIPEEGSDRGEPAIAGSQTAAAPVLDMIEEGHDHEIGRAHV